MSAFGRYCCKSLSGYEARNIDSSAVFTWLYAAERTLRREPIQLTFATVPAPSRRHLSAERCPLQRVKRSFRWTSRWSQTDPNRTPENGLRGLNSKEYRRKSRVKMQAKYEATRSCHGLSLQPGLRPSLRRRPAAGPAGNPDVRRAGEVGRPAAGRQARS